MSGQKISPRLTVLLSDLCIQEGGHRQCVALGIIEDVRRMENLNDFLKWRVVELESELVAIQTQLRQTQETAAYAIVGRDKST